MWIWHFTEYYWLAAMSVVLRSRLTFLCSLSPNFSLFGFFPTNPQFRLYKLYIIIHCVYVITTLSTSLITSISMPYQYKVMLPIHIQSSHRAWDVLPNMLHCVPKTHHLLYGKFNKYRPIWILFTVTTSADKQFVMLISPQLCHRKSDTIKNTSILFSNITKFNRCFTHNSFQSVQVLCFHSVVNCSANTGCWSQH